MNKIIKVVGVNEYAELVEGMQPSNLLNQLKEESNITLKTLNRITAPLGDVEFTFCDSLTKF